MAPRSTERDAGGIAERVIAVVPTPGFEPGTY